MGCYGAHYALSKEEADELCDCGGDEELLEFVDRLGRSAERKWSCDGDKFWEGLHRCLTDGRLDTGRTPLHSVILGPFSWYEGEDFHINVLDLKESKETLEAIKKIDRDWLRERYDALDQDECDWHLCDDDFECHWLYFKRVRAFFKRVVNASRWVMFTVNF